MTQKNRKPVQPNRAEQARKGEDGYSIRPMDERRKAAAETAVGKKQVNRPGLDLGGTNKEGRKGVHTTIPGGPRGDIPVGNRGK